MSFDGNKVLENYELVIEADEVVGLWEIVIDGCPVNPIKIKVVKIHHLENVRYMGIANYSVQNPSQASPYRSLHIRDTSQEALEDAISGFLAFYKPELKEETRFVLDENF